MKLPIGTAVHILGCEPNSPAEQFGIRFRDVGWVCDHYGMLQCCLVPEDCSCVLVVNDAGFQTRLCMQDCHLVECLRN
jgi:hypothetical protein